MALHNPPAGPAFLQNQQHNSEVLRQILQSLVNPGVVSSGDFAVTANGTPNMSVNVAAGFGVVPGTQSSPVQGAYHAYNDGTVNLAIAAADATNPRHDLVVLSIQDSSYSGSNNQALVQVVTGTPAGSPADPATPANSIVLARVQVNAAVSSITSGNITDLRTFATGLATGAGPYKFAVYQTVASSASNPVPFDHKQNDPSNLWSTTNNNFVCPAAAAGRWSFTGGITFTAGSAGSISVGIYKNGSEVIRCFTANAGSTTWTLPISGQLDLVAGDTVTIQATGLTTSIVSSAAFNTFQGTYEGR